MSKAYYPQMWVVLFYSTEGLNRTEDNERAFTLPDSLELGYWSLLPSDSNWNIHHWVSQFSELRILGLLSLLIIMKANIYNYINIYIYLVPPVVSKSVLVRAIQCNRTNIQLGMGPETQNINDNFSELPLGILKLALLSDLDLQMLIALFPVVKRALIVHGANWGQIYPQYYHWIL